MESTFPQATSARPRLHDTLQSREPRRRPFADYRRFIQHHYDGLPGALLAVTGRLTGHESLAGRLIRHDRFDVRMNSRET